MALSLAACLTRLSQCQLRKEVVSELICSPVCETHEVSLWNLTLCFLQNRCGCNIVVTSELKSVAKVLYFYAVLILALRIYSLTEKNLMS